MDTAQTPSTTVRRRRRAAATTLVATSFLLPAATADAATVKPADTVLRGGTIRTVDARDRVVQALAVRDGRIVYTGTNAGVRRYVGRGTRVEELRGRTVMPGLHDAHAHVGSGGTQLVRCNLEYAPLTVDQFLSRIQACLDAEKGAGGKWLEVVNWYRQAMRPAGTDVTRQVLDRLRTDRPIVVSSSDGHSTLGNTKALALAGITAATADPPSGQVVKDAAGQPTGILEDAAGGLLSAKVPAPTAADDRTAMQAALKALREQGVTSVGDQSLSTANLKAYRALHRRGELTVRLNAAPDVSVQVASKSATAAVRGLLRLRRAYETALTPAPGIRVRSTGEIFQDGVLQAPAHTASLLDPYLDEHGHATTDEGPEPYFPQATLSRLVTALVRSDFTPQVHAIGDRAVRHTLDAYAAVRKQVGMKPRLAVAHAEIVAPQDRARFRQLNVVPVMSFQWGKPAPDSIEAAKVFMGAERFDAIEPEGRLQQAGARIAYGSDWPVDALDEFFALEVGVTRRNDPASGYKGRLNTDPGLTRAQAIRAITMNAAYEMGTDRQTGSLERGKYADLVVLAQDPMTVPATRISETRVLRTMVGGRTVYRRR